MIIYDLETRRCVPERHGQRIPGMEYCAGWHDHAGMGISVVCTYDLAANQYGVWFEDNKDEFRRLIEGRMLVSYNGLAFDNNVLDACWGIRLDPARCYDVLVETWRAHGLQPPYQYPSHAGFSMDRLCACNDFGHKNGDGAMAPVLWQEGKIGTLVNYCLHDVKMLTRLTVAACQGIALTSPTTGHLFCLRKPQEYVR